MKFGNSNESTLPDALGRISLIRLLLLLLVSGIVLATSPLPGWAQAAGSTSNDRKGRILRTDTVNVADLIRDHGGPRERPARTLPERPSEGWGKKDRRERLPIASSLLQNVQTTPQEPVAGPSPRPSAPKTTSTPSTALTDAGGGGSGSGGGAPATDTPAPSSSFLALMDNETTFNPDVQGAVGPNHIMTVLSSEIRIQERDGTEISTVSLESFWSTFDDPIVIDPRLSYDALSGRWIQVAIANFLIDPGLLVGVSETDDPTGNWHLYFIDVDATRNVFAEYPNVGFNKNWIAVQANTFSKTSLEFTNSCVYIFSKTNLYNGGTANFTKYSLPEDNSEIFPEYPTDPFDTFDTVSSPIPATTMDLDTEELWFIGHWTGSFEVSPDVFSGFLRIYKVTGDIDTPVFEATDALAQSPGGFNWEAFDFLDRQLLPQRDSDFGIAAGDARLQNVVSRGGTLYTTHTIYLPVDLIPLYTSVQWWEILPNTSGVLQFGRVEEDLGLTSYAYPTIAVNSANDVLLGFGSFSEDYYASAAYAFKTDQDVPGQLRPNVILKDGEGPWYVPDSNDFNRWGDYNAAVVDPLNDTDMWTIQQYAATPSATSDRWGTWWGRISPPRDLQLTGTVTPGPIPVLNDITYSLSLTNLNIGQSVSGVTLFSIIPPGTEFVSASASTGSCEFFNGNIICDIGQMAEFDEVTATVVLRAVDDGNINVNFNVVGNGPELNAADNATTLGITVFPVADLGISGTAAPEPVFQLNNATYTLVVTNEGPSRATSVRVTNILDSITSYVSANPSQGNCSHQNGIVTCNLGALDAQASATITLLARADQPGSATLTTLVNSPVQDPQSANNAASINSQILARPTITPIVLPTIDEDDTTGQIGFMVNDVETPAGSLVVAAISSNPALVPNGNLVLRGTDSNRSIEVIPLENQFGDVTVTVTVTDGDNLSTTVQSSLTVRAVNDPPTVDPFSDMAVDEDGVLGPIGFTIGDVEKAASALNLSRSSSNTALVPNNGIVLGGSGANRTLTVTPRENAFGTTTITISVSDGDLTTVRNFLLTVNAVNDPPTLSSINNRSTNEDTPTGNIGFSVDDIEDDRSALVVTALSSNTDLVPSGNLAVTGNSGNRNLVATPMDDEFGQTTISVVVTDTEGGATTNQFVLTVNPVNDPPSFDDLADITIDEDSGDTLIPLSGILAGPPNEVQMLSITAQSSNNGRLPTPVVQYTSPQANGSLVINPATNVSGTVTVTVTVEDDGGGNDSVDKSFQVTILPVNDPPHVTDIPDMSVDEDDRIEDIPFSIGDVESSAGSLVVSADSSDPALVPVANITFESGGANRRVNVTPAPDMFGTCTISVLVSDGEDTTAETFVLTVNPINDLPTLVPPGNQNLMEDIASSPLPIAVDDLETDPGDLVLTATSSQPSLIPQGNLVLGGTGADRTLVIDPALDQSGNATITLVATDDEGGSVTNSFDVTVLPVNDPPTLSPIANQATDEDVPTPAIPVTVGDVESSPDSLVLTGRSSAPSLVADNQIQFSGTGAQRTVTIMPTENQFGTATITIEVSDGDRTANRQFDLTVNPVNDPPTIDPISDVTVLEDSGESVVDLTGLSNGNPAESDTLTIFIFSANPTVVPNPTLTYASPDTTGSLRFTPEPDQWGSSQITVFLDDGDPLNGLVVTTFNITVDPVNDEPTLDPIADETLFTGSGLQGMALSGIASGINDGLQNLTVSATSSNPGLVPHPTVSYASPAGDGTLQVQRPASGSGQVTITVTVQDDGGTANGGLNQTQQSFELTLSDPPRLNLSVTATQVILTWPLSATGFVPEYKDTMEDASWTVIPDSPTVQGPNYQLILPRTGTTRFFQLRHP